MPDIFHKDEINGVLEELKRVAQQTQISVASFGELAKNVNVVVERMDRILTKIEGVLK